MNVLKTHQCHPRESGDPLLRCSQNGSFATLRMTILILLLCIFAVRVWAVPPDTLQRQLRVLDNIGSQIRYLEESAAQTTHRISQYQHEITELDRATQQTQQRYQKLREGWGDYFQSFAHQYYQKLWQVPVLFNLEDRRQSARSLWAVQEFSEAAWEQLSSVKERLQKLQAKSSKWEEFKNYFSGLEETLAGKKQELKALVQIQQKVVSDASKVSGLSPEAQKTLAIAYQKVYLLKQRLWEKFDPSRIDISQLYVLPVMTYVHDQDFMKQDQFGIQFKAKAKEPVSAVDSGTIKTIAKTEQGWELTVQTSLDRYYVMEGLDSVFVQEGDEVKKNEILGMGRQGQEDFSWVSVRVYESGQPTTLTRAHFFSMNNTF